VVSPVTAAPPGKSPLLTGGVSISDARGARGRPWRGWQCLHHPARGAWARAFGRVRSPGRQVALAVLGRAPRPGRRCGRRHLRARRDV